MQALSSPSSGDVAIAEGYHAPGDGGGGSFSFDDLAITSTVLTTKTVSAASNASPIVVTTSTSHGFVAGQAVLITGVSGNTAANGMWRIAASPAPTSTTFALLDSAGNGNYTSGGTASSVTIVSSRAHGLVGGQRLLIR